MVVPNAYHYNFSFSTLVNIIPIKLNCILPKYWEFLHSLMSHRWINPIIKFTGVSAYQKLFIAYGQVSWTSWTVRMTPCPLRLQVQTSWTGGFLMGKMTFESDECFAKVVYMLKLDVLSIKTLVRMTPVLLDSTTRLCGQGASWLWRWYFREMLLNGNWFLVIGQLMSISTDPGCWLANWRQLLLTLAAYLQLMSLLRSIKEEA